MMHGKKGTMRRLWPEVPIFELSEWSWQHEVQLVGY